MSSFERITYLPLAFGGEFPFAIDDDAERDSEGDLGIA
jgi:hypothetical protein